MRLFCAPDGVAGRAALLLSLVLFAAPWLHGEYVVLRNGQRLKVTGYQLLGDKYRLQMAGGSVEVPAGDVTAIEPEDVFRAAPAKAIVVPPYRELVEAAAARYHVDADLITSVIAVESNFDPKAVSRKNARGLMQLPQENIDAGTRYLRELLQKYNNDLVLALAAYNAGPDRVQQYGTVPPYAETISYVRRVKRSYEKSKSNPPARAATRPGAVPATSLPRGAPSQ